MTEITVQADAAACETALRQIVANRLPLDILADVLVVPMAVVTAMVGGVYPSLDAAQRERLELLGAVIVRAEIRCGNDHHAVMRLLQTPMAALDDHAPAEVMRHGVDALRAVHRVMAEMVVPEQRWWRAAPRR